MRIGIKFRVDWFMSRRSIHSVIGWLYVVFITLKNLCLFFGQGWANYGPRHAARGYLQKYEPWTLLI